MKSRIFLATLLIFVLVNSAQAGLTEELRDCGSGVQSPKEFTIESTKLPLLGCSLFRYWGFAVYTAALYGPPRWASNSEFQLDHAAKLVLHYHRNIAAGDIATSANDFLAKQNEAIPQSVRLAVDTLHRAYEDVAPGDSYSLEYLPEKGTRLLRNNRFVIEIPGQAFASYYFRIWLDDKQPIDRELRGALLKTQ